MQLQIQLDRADITLFRDAFFCNVATRGSFLIPIWGLGLHPEGVSFPIQGLVTQPQHQIFQPLSWHSFQGSTPTGVKHTLSLPLFLPPSPPHRRWWQHPRHTTFFDLFSGLFLRITATSRRSILISLTPFFIPLLFEKVLR